VAEVIAQIVDWHSAVDRHGDAASLDDSARDEVVVRSVRLPDRNPVVLLHAGVAQDVADPVDEREQHPRRDRAVAQPAVRQRRVEVKDRHVRVASRRKVNGIGSIGCRTEDSL
jgi:hypothetical protein